MVKNIIVFILLYAVSKPNVEDGYRNFLDIIFLRTLCQGKLEKEENRALADAMYELADYTLHGDDVQVNNTVVLL